MSKRSTETVLRDEVSRAEKEHVRARSRASSANEAVHEGERKLAAAEKVADDAAGALLRARQALSAFVGGPVDKITSAPIVSAVKTDAGTTSSSEETKS